MVSWQALFYSLSFYFTWPVVLLVYVTGWDFEKKVYGFSVLVSLVAPLQGFNNMLVYFRPRLVKCLGQYISSRRPTLTSSITDNGGHRSRMRGSNSEAALEESTTEEPSQYQGREYVFSDPSVAIAEDYEIEKVRPGDVVSSLEAQSGLDVARKEEIGAVDAEPVGSSTELQEH